MNTIQLSSFVMAMAMLKIPLSRSHHPPPKQKPILLKPINANSCLSNFNFFVSRRLAIFNSFTTSLALLTSSSAASAETPSSFLSSIANTKSWFQFFGDGFAIRVPPQFEDLTEPEDYNAGLSLYGDKAKPKTFAARFASPDGHAPFHFVVKPLLAHNGAVINASGNKAAIQDIHWVSLSEVVSVVIRPSNQLKITFLEAKDITDLGSLKEAAKIFVPGGATLYSARAIKIKEDEGYRNYYFYEFGKYEQRVALVAAVNSGKAFIAGATAPQNKWDNDGVRLRSAAVSLTLL